MAPTNGSALKKIRDSILALGYRHPHFLLIWDRVKHRAKESTETATMAVDDAGTIYVNPTFAETLTGAETGGVICHELMHLIYTHANRRGDRDHKLWNVACDMVINDALRKDGITLPECALYPPADYHGTLQAEPLFDFLQAHPPPPPPTPKGGKPGDPNGEPQPGAGCGPVPAPEGDEPAPGMGDGNAQPGEGGSPAPALREGETWDDLRSTVEAVCDQIGRGSSAVRALIRPVQARSDWKRILRAGVQMAVAAQTRDVPTYSRVSRRQIPGTIRPGWTGTNPRVAVVIDCSGSMDRKWIDQIVAECKLISATFPGLRMRLTTHTDRVTFDGWVSDMGRGDTLTEAVSFTGGTDAKAAYEAVAKAGRFDTLIHFTDGELHWPQNPARKLVVGAFGSAADGRPWQPFPKGAHVIPCAVK
jgi:predicted metal-dependent peptidase